MSKEMCKGKKMGKYYGETLQKGKVKSIIIIMNGLLKYKILVL